MGQRYIIDRSDYVISDGTNPQTVISLDLSEFGTSGYLYGHVMAEFAGILGDNGEGVPGIDNTLSSLHMVRFARLLSGTPWIEAAEIAVNGDNFASLPPPTFDLNGNTLRMRWVGDTNSKPSSAMGRFHGLAVVHTERVP